MSLNLWWLFITAVFLLSATPGPNMLHILSRSVELGVRRTMFAMAGCMSALLLILSGSALGVTTLLFAIPGAFDALRLLGVAYLLYLGVKAWRSDVDENGQQPDKIRANTSAMALFRGGFLIGISNPKALLFAAAFLPQFVNPALPKVPQFAILVLTFAMTETLWYFIYALGGRSLAHHLSRPALKRLFNRITGGVFIAFGLALLRIKPS
ncbi:MAG: LysE family translocator [Sphingobium sp.]|nr:LysE family translocator [Sphingobium sp.]